MSSPEVEIYMRKREGAISQEQAKATGWNLILNDKEQLVNKILMKYKHKELDDGMADPECCLFAQHFFKARKGIEQSQIFKIIQKLPKGASLHSHDTALVSEEYVFNLTYKENLYFSEDGGSFRLKFFHPKPAEGNWKLVKDVRNEDNNFDKYLRSKLTLIVDNPQDTYRSTNDVWQAFIDKFTAVSEMIEWKPVWQEYFYQALKEMYEDNVRYFEFRGVLPNVYDLDGKIYDHVEVVGLYYETLNTFMTDYPDFFGAKFIYAPSRQVDSDTMDSYMKIFEELKSAFPDFIAGFDLVGQEDLGEPLLYFIPQLLKMKENGAEFLFHAGETNWQGCNVDSNIFDAILLNTKRIGHGLAIVKHPHLLDSIKRNGIAVEICPISNQVLNLISDLRNHPGAILIANDYPIVIGPDDPSFWGAKGLSYDWYIAFMAMASRCDDLRFLKQLALNSLKYSSMTESERNVAIKRWEVSWDIFIDDILQTYCNCKLY